MNMFKKHSSLFSFLGLIAIVLITFSSLNPHFMAVNNMLKAFRALSITALAALGLTFVVAIGYSDMSFHFVSCFAAMAMSYCISLKMHPVLAIVLGLAAAAVFGVINGIAIGRFKLPDMIVTIGLGTAVYGLAYIFSGGAYIYRNFLKSGIMELNNGLIADIPLPVIFLIVIYFAAWLLLHRSIYGRRFYAIGGNELAAEYSGIKVRRYIIAAFIICAVLSAFPNMIQIAAQGKGYLKGGLTLLMPAWSAVFVGISIFKRPTVYGTFMGAFLVSIMQNGFTMLSVPFYYMDGVIAIVLMVSIAFSGVELSSLIKKDRKGGEKGPMSHNKFSAGSIFRPNLILLWLLAAMLIFFSLQSETFRSLENLMEVLRSCGIIAFMVLGATWIIASGEMDIIFPDIAAFSSMVLAILIKNNYSWVSAVILAVLLGSLYGVLNGTLVAKLKFPALIASIAVGSLAKAVANLINKGQPLYLMNINDSVQYLVYGKILGIPVLILLVIAVYFLASWIQDRALLGQHLYALGENRSAALEAGIKKERIIFSFYILSAVLASISGVLLAASFNSGQPRIGNSFFVDGLTSIFLGAMIIKAGKPNVIGTLFGAIIISVLTNGLTLLGIPYYVGSIIKGVLMVAGVAVIALSRRGIIK